MPPHQEEEIEGASNRISDAPFVTEIRKSRRSKKLPQRYKVEKSPDIVSRRKRSTRNLKINLKVDSDESKGYISDLGCWIDGSFAILSQIYCERKVPKTGLKTRRAVLDGYISKY